ncbi:plasmid replication protein RepC [Salipiger marinus]|uniref:plasmid replication protein RepC n=1 Tax=Salipiger marinus TaxID=555512 RepID=UPI002CABA306|nr:plasmid replication protein RepC [Salipiger manganoxidans]MEB3420220.1 plasmid replication protein RepC [Salipiger manganoxidans]
MDYIPLSPFMRPMTHAHLRGVPPAEAPAPDRSVNKWAILRDLSKAQAAFGITERDLTVLQGLLSFCPETELATGKDIVVFPSNKTICERLNGMPCSTMRRHLARLVEAGLLIRRDSPNGKRYMRRLGPERVAFGFDLSPLLHRATEITQAAEAVREAETRLQHLREVISLMRRDLAALAEFGEDLFPGLGLWDQLRDRAALTVRALRRKLKLDDLAQQKRDLETLLDAARQQIDGVDAAEMVTTDARNEQHQQRSQIDSLDLEQGMESGTDFSVSSADECDVTEDRPKPSLPLRLVLAACPSLRTFYPQEIRHWHHLHDAACKLRTFMGISPAAWNEAQRHMGPEQAAITVAAILERVTEIRSPGGYLRALTAKAAAGHFSSSPMIMALCNRPQAA